MALNKGIWDPKLRGTNIKGTNLKSLNYRDHDKDIPMRDDARLRDSYDVPWV